MTGPTYLDVGVDTSDLPVTCNCGCTYCCTNNVVKLPCPVRNILKAARPLKYKQLISVNNLPEVRKGITIEEPNVGGDFRSIINITRKEPSSDFVNTACTRKKKFCCDVCKAEFTRKYSLNIHLQKHAPRKGDILPKDQLLQEPNLPAAIECNLTYCGKPTKESLECELCNKIYESSMVLYNHILEEHEDDSKQEKLMKTLAVLLRCQDCGQEFHRNGTLGALGLAATSSKKYLCITCQAKPSSYLNLSVPSVVQKHHKQFRCAVCGATFSKKDSLSTHLRKHSGERPFVCDICGANFDRKFTLKNHRVLHSGQRPHVCAVCGKSFPTRGALGAHERATHSNKSCPPICRRRPKDFQPSICEECGKVYSNAANLRIHKQTHSGSRPFLCPVCGAAFAKKYTLQCHMRRHTDERPFKCEECEATFFRQSTLDTHKRRHTGEKPHQCELCERRFIQKASLQYHLKHHDHTGDIGSSDSFT